MKNLLISLFFLVMVSSCRPIYHVTSQSQTTSDTSETIQATTRPIDTTIYSLPDSAFLTLLAECDSSNQVIIKQLRNRAGERTQIKYRTIRQTDTLKIYIQSKIDSAAIYLQFKARDTTKTRTIRQTTTTTNTQQKQTQNLPEWLYFAGFILFLLIVGVIWKR
jgi:hypothetical protein